MIRNILKLHIIFILCCSLTGCDIVQQMYSQAKKDVKAQMFPNIEDQSPPLTTDTYICDSARTLLIYKNEGTGTVVVEYEGRASFLERIPDIEDEMYQNNQSTLRIRDDGVAELAREQVPFLTNCEQQMIQHKKEFIN